MTPIQHFHLSAILTALVNFILVIFVIKRAPATQLKKRFGWYGTSIVFWSFFLWFCSSTLRAHTSDIACQLLHGAAILIPCFFLHFVLVYLNRLDKTEKRALTIAYGSSLIFLMIDLFAPRLLLASVAPKLGFPYYVEPGPLYQYWIFLFAVIVLYGHARLLQGVLSSSGNLRQQRLFFLVGNVLGYLGGIGIFMPVYNLAFFPFPYGAYGVLLFSLVTVYTIIRFRFIEIDVLVKRTIVFAGLFGMAMSIVAIVSGIANGVMGKYFSVPPYVISVGSALIVMLIFDFVRKYLVNITDKFLFQKQFKLSSIMAQASQAIAFVQSLKWLSRRIIAFLVTKCRIKHAMVYICNEQSGRFIRGAIRGYPVDRYPLEELPDNHLVIRYLYESRRPIEIRRLEDLIEKNKSDRMAQTGLQMVLEFMKVCQAQVLIPSFLRRRIDEPGVGKEQAVVREKDDEIILRNILILGEKKSDEQYTDEDLDMFYTLAQESAIAIENARLYDEAVEKTRLLGMINRELADTNEKLQVTQASLIVAEKNATMVGMAQAIGHEVNNPLTTVLMRVDTLYKDKIKRCRDLVEKISAQPQGSTEACQKLVKLTVSMEDDLARASRSAHRINAVVHTLTDILRDTKGEMGALSLRVLFHEAIEATRFSTYEENLAGCEIKLDVASNIMIHGNLEQLLQVFVNLIKNAYEAMDKTKERKIVISGDLDPSDSKRARILLADNGPGIPSEVLPRIWGQGFTTKIRQDNSLGAAGQGQGLFVCKHMIESVHRGAIACESVVGKGTTFIIKLPIADMEVHYA
ncbi:MAG: sensor histidine kinase [Candidatus Omnitrophica bacterium]|nr:sensor histidine kinase [Candidatus Omnitrophota bacterium]